MKREHSGCWQFLGIVLLSLVCLEVASRASFRLLTGQSPPAVRLRLTQALPPATAEVPRTGDSAVGWIRDKVLHPYLGFVGNPNHHAPLSSYINEFGFHGEPAPVRDGPDQLVIAITGGSVAMNYFFHVRTDDAFLQELQLHPAFADKDIRIVSLAIDGMKQPQQLMALNYLLSLGRRIDYVINLDGFNEVVLPYVDNIPHGVFPFYPRSWQWYAATAIAPDHAVLLQRIAHSRRRGFTWQRRLAATPLRYSYFSLAAWHAMDRRRRSREAAWETQLMAARPGSAGLGPQERGPHYSSGSIEDVVNDSVAVWRRSSTQMSRLCTANGIGYLHVLQPNQYLQGSKPLSEEELRVAIGPPEYGYRRAAERGFPILRRVGQELMAEGIPFEDLTDLFADVGQTVYTDTCCHLNKLGYQYVSRRIVDRLTQSPQPTGRPDVEEGMDSPRR